MLTPLVSRHRASRIAALGLPAAAFMGFIASSCAPPFEAASHLSSVRILASRADKPYARPGDTVKLDVLAFDGRADKTTRPMKVFWIPLVCTNPPEDLYYLCFAQFLGGAGGTSGSGAGSGALNPAAAILKPGVDLSPFLPTGPSYSITIPANIVATHPKSPEPNTPAYGLAIAFNIACAGHVELTARDPNDLRTQQIPLGCFDENHVRLDATQYVTGFTRVYAYTDPTVTNANPIITQATFQGIAVDPNVGIQTDHCNVPHRTDCPPLKIDVVVPDSSQELGAVDDVDQNGTRLKEEIWADYYSDIGDFQGDARLLFDARSGRIGDSAITYDAPVNPSDGVVSIVVHDNRGGAAWTQFPVHVR